MTEAQKTNVINLTPSKRFKKDQTFSNFQLTVVRQLAGLTMKVNTLQDKVSALQSTLDEWEDGGEEEFDDIEALLEDLNDSEVDGAAVLD